MIKSWSDDAWEDFEYWTKQDKKTLKRILLLLKDIDRNGYNGIGKPKQLSGNLSGYWSRRTDECNRIVFKTIPVGNLQEYSLTEDLCRCKS